MTDGDAGVVASLADLLGLAFLFGATRRRAWSLRRKRYAVIAGLLLLSLVQAVLLGDFEFAQCGQTVAYRRCTPAMILVACLFAPWLIVLPALTVRGKWLVSSVAMPLLLGYLVTVSIWPGIAVMLMVVVSAAAWWHALPLLLDRSPDFGESDHRLR